MPGKGPKAFIGLSEEFSDSDASIGPASSTRPSRLKRKRRSAGGAISSPNSSAVLGAEGGVTHITFSIPVQANECGVVPSPASDDGRESGPSGQRADSTCDVTRDSKPGLESGKVAACPAVENQIEASSDLEEDAKELEEHGDAEGDENMEDGAVRRDRNVGVQGRDVDDSASIDPDLKEEDGIEDAEYISDAGEAKDGQKIAARAAIDDVARIAPGEDETDNFEVPAPSDNENGNQDGTDQEEIQPGSPPKEPSPRTRARPKHLQDNSDSDFDWQESSEEKEEDVSEYELEDVKPKSKRSRSSSPKPKAKPLSGPKGKAKPQPKAVRKPVGKPCSEPAVKKRQKISASSAAKSGIGREECVLSAGLRNSPPVSNTKTNEKTVEAAPRKTLGVRRPMSNLSNTSRSAGATSRSALLGIAAGPQKRFRVGLSKKARVPRLHSYLTSD